MAKNLVVLFFIFFMAFTVGASAQSTDLKINVVDSAGAPVAGALVVLKNRVSGKELSGTTDGDGHFTFKQPADTVLFDVVVSANGFERSLHPLAAGETSVILTLAPGQIREDVTVTATRTQVLVSETAVPVSVIGREEIERKAVNTISDIFRTLPGTSTNNEGAFQVRPRIRGLDSNRVLILVDGERLNNSRTSTSQSGVETGLVETSQIETVEVVRGSGSVLYGTDALGGTINIITRDTPARRDNGFHFGGTIDTLYSSNESGRRGNLALNGAGKLFAFRLAQSMERYANYFTGKPDGSVIDGVTPEGEVLNSQSHGSNTQATARFYLNDYNTIKLNYERRRAANIGSPTLVGVFNGFFPFSNRDKFNGRYDVASVTKQLQRVSVSGFYQTQKRNFTNVLTVPPQLPFFPGQFQFSETVTDTKTSGLDLQTDWTLGSRNTLVAGASFFRDDNSDHRLIISGSTPTSADQTRNTSQSVPDASLTNVAAFAQDEYKLLNRMKLIGGIRVDRFNTNARATEGFAIPSTFTPGQIADLGLAGLTDGLKVTNTAITGDLGAVYTLTKNINLSARVGRSFRTPNIFERFFTDFGSAAGFVVGNPQLKPETGINFDTSVKFHTTRFAGSATYFNNMYTNLLATVQAIDHNGAPIVIPRPPRAPIPVFQTQNVSKARIQGFEAEFEVPIKISFGLLTPNGNFSYLRGDNTDLNVPLDFISPVRTNVGVRWQNFGKNYFFDYTVRIVNRQDRLSPAFKVTNGGAEPGFVAHNMSGGYYFRRERGNFNINVGVSNLFNRFYNEQFVFAPARGRSFTFGTSWEIK